MLYKVRWKNSKNYLRSSYIDFIAFREIPISDSSKNFMEWNLTMAFFEFLIIISIS